MEKVDTIVSPVDGKISRLDHEIVKLEFNKAIAGCYRDGHAEYDAVGVLLLTWREDDLNCKEIEVNALEHVFKEKFKYKTEQYEIPPIESKQSLFNRLDAFISYYDSPSKLGIIYYGGHAERVDSSEGSDLQLFARRTTKGLSRTNTPAVSTSLDGLDLAESAPGSPVEVSSRPDSHVSKIPHPRQPQISFAAICERLKTSETDILLIVDSCFAAGAFRDEPFGGRKCELLCSIAEKDWARAPSLDGSFTQILTSTLAKMIGESPRGFSTSDLYRQVYRQQHQARKPLLFNQSNFDFGKIWLRPCEDKEKTDTATDSSYTIDVRFHLTKSATMMDLNRVAKALQWIPYVQKVDMLNMHSPADDLRKFMKRIHAANMLRPLLARIRRKRERQQALQLRRTDTSPPSSPIADTTSELFLGEEPRNIGLFNWSDTKAVTPHHERFSPGEYFSLEFPHSSLHERDVQPERPDAPTKEDAAPQQFSRQEQADVSVKRTRSAFQRVVDVTSQRVVDGLLFFTLGVLAPTVIRWAMQGSAIPFAAS
ncbi:hypothetical protein BDV96DRAFT_654133 [Lophiotrema nucula]|uniref:Caspase domain-containing protein n=1 Tax=Lophiotrema nucula TaxID=690887 RepID=A0A6A5YIJ6_9PLEO|nr:hypothetical protein BDV96DRAFT_654133 [Lophiotrema nucula]